MPALRSTEASASTANGGDAQAQARAVAAAISPAITRRVQGRALLPGAASSYLGTMPSSGCTGHMFLRRLMTARPFSAQCHCRSAGLLQLENTST